MSVDVRLGAREIDRHCLSDIHEHCLPMNVVDTFVCLIRNARVYLSIC